MRRILLLLALLLPLDAWAQGHLVIVGGGPRPPAVIERIVALAGGADARIVVIPYASEEPAETGAFQRDQFLEYGARWAAVAAGDPRADSTLALLNGATGVFFSGGDQRRLAATLHGTPLLDAVRAVRARGGVVSGTSAGAAVMSRVMITGDEAANPDSLAHPFSTVEPRNVVTSEGLAFVEGVIVDQHFVVRKRQNRLLSLVLEHPDLVGIGIDEETAAVVRPDGRWEVVGNRGVQVFDAREAAVAARERGFSARGVRLHVFTAGDVFAPEAPGRPAGGP